MAAMDRQRNRLGDEKSPYLLQHAGNPVGWQPWGPEAFAEARRRDVPVFLSVGYSTCHWCHVMERESFEHDDVARALNEGFVAIKVDREERPDVDAIYMQAIQAMGERGGWPMSVWLTPDGAPFYGGTYYPKEHFLFVLEQLRNVWTNDRARAITAGASLREALEQSMRRARAGSLDDGPLRGFAEQFAAQFDPRHGGRQGAPKFPHSYDLQLLLRVARRSGDPHVLAMVTTSLDAMARGGMYDHVGGGFHRYSTDERWLVPHFEKMLYDQAALAGAYLDGWLVTRNEEYAHVVREILDYVLRDLTGAEGAFLSAEDADSEGEEGRFYVWTDAELRAVLTPEQYAALAAEFEITARGNFEHGTNILALRPDRSRVNRPTACAAALARLIELRETRVRPHRDDKVLADWNGLAIASMARAGRVLGAPRFVAAAARAADFVLTRMRDAGGRLLHRWRAGEAAIPGFLDDHAFLVHGLIELFQADGDARWLHEAAGLQDAQERLFGADGDYRVDDGSDPTVILSRVDFWDNVTPAGRSVSALNLLRLAGLLLEPARQARAAAVFASTPQEVRQAPTAFAVLLAALDYALDESKELALAGSPGDPALAEAARRFAESWQPNAVIATGPPDAPGVPLLAGRRLIDGKVTAYVCERGACRLPTNDIDAATAAFGQYRQL